MKSILAAGLAGMAMAKAPKYFELTAEYSYSQWVEDFSPTFPGTEEAFQANLKQIMAHNADSSKTWKAGVNQVSFQRGTAPSDAHPTREGS